METTWIGCAPDNFHPGRPAGMKPETIVLHSLAGSLVEGGQRFNRPGTSLSAHYGVGQNGEIHHGPADAQNRPVESPPCG